MTSPGRSTGRQRTITPPDGGRGLDWLPPDHAGPRMPRVRAARRRVRVPGWLAAVTSLAALVVVGFAIRNTLVDDTVTPARVRLGAQLGGELARREILRYRAREGRWPSDLKAVKLDRLGLTYTSVGDRFEVTGPDGGSGRVRYEGSVDDLPSQTPGAGAKPPEAP